MMILDRSIDGGMVKQMFTEARTHTSFNNDPVSDIDIQMIHHLAKWGPTAANSLPMRVVWLRSIAAQERLVPALDPGNVAKVRNAPVTAIVAYGLDFPDTLPETFPHTDARAWYAGKPELVAETAFRNGTLQGAYLIFAARALGFDVGPMSGFDADKVNAEFFAGTNVRVNFLLNIGHGDGANIHPRSPRLSFDRVNTVL